ncbi:lipocalin-like domain-containing protein (plasmid) [Streptomyces sp. NBC_00841]|uniref:lipocalin-like domain-containing protein n=1 Tax=unclassified Streptomyces TaxID=2593676 RepID=UPI00224FF4A6|nr:MULTISPECIES: lipocalin-like domain-containing protein [unclassified Streptomyces]MCX4537990.1 lipocalin-like domain-containing protein [Streptomyces sp. NBC_01669]WSA05168.1 lipocalin-like domain-containing protein [Streptomyces sp. NBC_00841]
MNATEGTAADAERKARDEVRGKLLGAWRLVSYTATSTDGDVIEPLGPNPNGLILYTPQGYMSAQLGRSDRPLLSSARLEDAMPEELARTTVGYLAYGGPFEVVDATTVEHHVTTSLFPNWTGHPQTRKVSFDGPLLTLAVPTPTRLWGAERTAELVWERPA